MYTTTSWVWHSLDGGKTWQSLNVLNTGALSGLAIVDSQTLVVVSGTDDLIFRSTNGGQTFAAVPHPRGGTWFGSVRFVPGTQTGWTVGTGGKILKSTDGGATWTLQQAATHSYNLIDVSFADLNNGWTAGGQELHTTDGGLTWLNQDSGVFAPVSVYAVSPTTAWIGGLPEVARTTDGGATWTIETTFRDGLVCDDVSGCRQWLGRGTGPDDRRRSRQHLEKKRFSDTDESQPESDASFASPIYLERTTVPPEQIAESSRITTVTRGYNSGD